MDEIQYNSVEMSDKEFIENIFEIVFGDNAINKDYSKEEVVSWVRTFSDQSHKFETLGQGSILHDKESFVALVCSTEDIAEQIKDPDQDEPTKAEEKLALTMVNSEYFRKKFTEIIMNDFWETIDCIRNDKEMMKVIKKENKN